MLVTERWIETNAFIFVKVSESFLLTSHPRPRNCESDAVSILSPEKQLHNKKSFNKHRQLFCADADYSLIYGTILMLYFAVPL